MSGGPVRRYFSRPAGLGPERDHMGNRVRPIMVERVAQDWAGGKLVREVRDLKATGRLALVVGPAS